MSKTIEKPLTTGKLRNQLKGKGVWKKVNSLCSLFDTFDYAVNQFSSRPSLDYIHQHFAAKLVSFQKKKFGAVIRELNGTRFLEHCLGETTLYVCSKPSRHALLCFDIDRDQIGVADSVIADAATEVNTVLGHRLYWEPSTHGRGLHGWIVVKYDGNAERLREWANDYKALLNDNLNTKAYHVDIQGLPAITKGQGWESTYQSAGTLIKAPRLKTVDDFEYFFSHCPFMQLDFSDTHTGWEVVATDTSAKRIARKKLKGNRIDELLGHSNPFLSRTGACLAATERYGKEATWQDAIKIYEEEGAATGDRTNERIEWFKDYIQHCVDTYDTSKRKGMTDGLAYMQKRLTPILESAGYVDTANPKKKHALNFSDFSLFATIFKYNLLSSAGRVPQESLLKAYEAIGQPLSKKKWVRYKGILSDLGIVSVKRAHSRLAKRATEYDWSLVD